MPSLPQPASSTSAPGRSASAKHSDAAVTRSGCPLPSPPLGKNQ